MTQTLRYLLRAITLTINGLHGRVHPITECGEGDQSRMQTGNGKRPSWRVGDRQGPTVLCSNSLRASARKNRIGNKTQTLGRTSHHGSGRAGLQPRRYKAFLIIPPCRAPRSPAPAGLRGARDQQRAGAAISAGLKPRPSGSTLGASKRGEKSGLKRLRKNSFGVSFRGAAGDEESRIGLKTLRARFLAPLGMTAWMGFSAACKTQVQGSSGFPAWNSEHPSPTLYVSGERTRQEPQSLKGTNPALRAPRRRLPRQMDVSRPQS
jgi:hypothetical protein